MTSRVAVSRRQFLAHASSLASFYSLAGATQLGSFASRSVLDDPRIAQTPLVDAGFASVRKIGEGAYATISDPSKGITTMCNGGFLFGKDAALLIEGFVTPAGAAFQLDTFHKVAQTPVTAALDTHYHFDHSLGNSFYGGNGIPVWGHSAVAKRISDSYLPLQAADRATVLAPFNQRMENAKSEVQKQHAQTDLTAMGNVFDLVNKSALTLPNRLLDGAKLPLHLDLGHYPIILETHPGHSGTDIVVRAPEQKIVFSGDLIFNGRFPATFDEQATISGWRNTLKTFASWDKDTIFVPGHGPVCGQEGVQQLRDLFDDLSEQAEKLRQAGVPVEEAGDRYVIPDKFKGFSMFAWGFCITPAISKLYAERGKT